MTALIGKVLGFGASVFGGVWGYVAVAVFSAAVAAGGAGTVVHKIDQGKYETLVADDAKALVAQRDADLMAQQAAEERQTMALLRADQATQLAGEQRAKQEQALAARISATERAAIAEQVKTADMNKLEAAVAAANHASISAQSADNSQQTENQNALPTPGLCLAVQLPPDILSALTR